MNNQCEVNLLAPMESALLTDDDTCEDEAWEEAFDRYLEIVCSEPPSWWPGCHVYGKPIAECEDTGVMPF